MQLLHPQLRLNLWINIHLENQKVMIISDYWSLKFSPLIKRSTMQMLLLQEKKRLNSPSKKLTAFPWRRTGFVGNSSIRDVNLCRLCNFIRILRMQRLCVLTDLLQFLKGAKIFNEHDPTSVQNKIFSCFKAQ